MESSNKFKNIMKNKEDSIVIDNVKTIFLDEIMLRFPHVVQGVFEELDDKTLTKCRNLSRSYCDFIEDEKFYWVRKIQNCVRMTKFQEQWNNVLKNIPTQDAKEIFVIIGHFFQSDLNRKKLQWSPLHIAAEQGHLEFCKYIIEKTKDSNPTREDGITAIHMATLSGSREICELIINNLEDKNPADNKGMTPFHIAAEKGHWDVCKLLIQNIDNKNPVALDGCTPLHLATYHGHLEIVRLIVNSGVHKSPLWGDRTPLDLVKTRSCYMFYKLLMDDTLQIWKCFFTDIIVTFLFLSFCSMCAYASILFIFFLFCHEKNTCNELFEPSNLPWVVFVITITIDLLLASMSLVYLSGCIHKYTNNFCFHLMSISTIKF